MCIYSPMPHTLSYCALIGKCALIRSNTVCSLLPEGLHSEFILCSGLKYDTDHHKVFDRMDGWLTCDFRSCLTVFQSYQDNGRVRMKAMCNQIRFMIERSPPQVGLEPGTARSVGQGISH